MVLSFGNDQYNLMRIKKKDLSSFAKKLGFDLNTLSTSTSQTDIESDDCMSVSQCLECNQVNTEQQISSSSGLNFEKDADTKRSDFVNFICQSTKNLNMPSAERSSKDAFEKPLIGKDNSNHDTDLLGVQDNCSPEASFHYIDSRFSKVVLPKETKPFHIKVPHSTFHMKVPMSMGIQPAYEFNGSNGTHEQNISSKVNSDLCRDMPDDKQVDALIEKLHAENAEYFSSIATDLQNVYNQYHLTNCGCGCVGQKNFISLNIHQILQSTHAKLTDEQDACIKILHNHANSCQQAAKGYPCSVPYCEDLRNASQVVRASNLDFDEPYMTVFFQKERFLPVESNTDHVVVGQNFQLNCAKHLASGAFASVYEAWFHAGSKNARVAIRKMKLPEQETERQHTVDNYCRLRELLIQDCPYLLTPDIILKSDNYFITIMRCEVTNLRGYIARKEEMHRRNSNCVSTLHLMCGHQYEITPTQMFFWFRQLAEGVQFLHANKRIHGDLKPDNVLITVNGTLKICDLDSVQILNENQINKHVTGTFGYADPHVFTHGMTFSSDVYSLAMFIPAMLGLVDMCLDAKNDMERYVVDMEDRNDLMCGVLRQCNHIIAFSALFGWIVKLPPNCRPCIDLIVQCLREHPQFENHRKSTELNVKDHLTRSFLYDENVGIRLFRKWIMNQLDDGLIPDTNHETNDITNC